MIGEDVDSAIVAAKKMIRFSPALDQFYLDRLDLSAEAVVLKEEYRELFTTDDLALAR
jgi:hypothetical protein